MKRVITSLSLLLLLLCGAYAQDISQYEYWTDDEYASRSVVTSSEGNISLEISTASLTAGIHFLNFRAGRNDGVWGNFYRYLYYIPTLKSVDTGDVTVEYWLDDNLAGRQSEEAEEGSLSLTIDISSLSPGVHYFNCTPISSSGERGNSERYLFYVPLPQDQTSVSAIKGYEYWIDDNYAGKTVKESAGGDVTLTVCLDGLSSGVHYFNCRAYNERGEYGNPVREMFYIPLTHVNSNAAIASAEYWLDDDYDNKVSVTGSDTQQAFTIDISQLSSGVHYFNYRAIDNEGCYGNIIRQMFYIAQSNDASAGEIVEYEYWIDDDVENKVTGNDPKRQYVFSIDISGLEIGTHTFNFRGKDALDNWGDTFTETFEIPELDPNRLVLADITSYKGKRVVMPIAMINEKQITGLQFDLYLPSGVTVAKKSNGKMLIETTDRMDGNYTISSEQMDGFVRILGYSVDGDAFTGDSGDILNVTLDISDDMEGGDYSISLKDIVLSDINSKEYHPDDVEATLKIESYMLGDVDNSGAVNINDVVCIINYILNRPMDTFIEEAADVDGSGTININDVVLLINRYILMNNNAPALIEMMSSQNQTVSEYDNYMLLEDMEIAPGETKEVQLLLTNVDEVAAVQGNIKLPAGLSFVTKSDGQVDVKSVDEYAENFTLTCALQNDGSLTFTQYSADGHTYGNNDGILTFKVKAADDMATGTYSVALSDVVLSIGGVAYDVPNRMSALMVVGTTGISPTDNEQWSIDNYYTLDGVRHEGKPTQKGVYIVNGKTIIKK